jgi:Arc/MetJ-type ribon-helix-helix transcriptional regulator
MSYALSPEIDQLVQLKKASGKYDSEESVLRAALQALDEKESTLAAIQEGYDDYLAGRFQSLEEADRSFRSQNGIA